MTRAAPDGKIGRKQRVQAWHLGLSQSPHVRRVDVGDGYFVIYHRLFGNPQLVSQRELKLFDTIGTDAASSILHENSDARRIIRCFVDALLIIPSSRNERKAVDSTRDDFESELRAGKRCNALSLVLTDGCNFSCKHCLPHQVADSNQVQRGHMSVETARAAIDDFIRLTATHDQVPQLYFGGREPLLNWRVLEDSIVYSAGKAAEVGRTLMYIVFTNCSLLTLERVDFLKRYDVCVVSSMDGIKDINDKRRTMHSEDASAYEATIRGWKLLRDAGMLRGCFNCTIDANSCDALSEDLISFAKEWGMSAISINVDETRLANCDVKAVTVAVQRFRAMAQSKGLVVNGQWQMVFANLFRNVGNSINTGFCSAYTGHSVTVRPGGYYSLCSPDAKTLAAPQSLMQLLASNEYRNAIIPHYVGSIEYCRGCDIEGFCMGGCGVATDQAIQNGFTGYSRCDFFRSTFDVQLVEYCRSFIESKGLRLRLPAALETCNTQETYSE